MEKTVILGIDGWYPQVDGGTNVVLSYRENLKKVCDCEIVAPSYGKKADEEGEREYCSGVFHNFSLGVPFISFRNSFPGFDRRLKKFLNEKKPCLLHAHSPFAICGYFSRYGKKHKIPVVFTFHTRFKDEFMRVTHSRLATAIMMSVIMRNIRKADYVWAVSASAADALRGYGYKGEIRVMPNATDMPVATPEELATLSLRAEKEYGILPGERILIFAGRVVSVKNIGFALSVVAELKRRGFACRFFIVGGGDELEYFKKYAERVGVSDMVTFTGYIGDRQQIRSLYARADLLLFPSEFDTFGLVVMEAAACRTPSLVPEGSGAAELIKDGVTGYTQPLEVPLWADKIEHVFEGGQHDVVSSACTSVVSGWDEAVARAVEVYGEIIADYTAKHS